MYKRSCLNLIYHQTKGNKNETKPNQTKPAYLNKCYVGLISFLIFLFAGITGCDQNNVSSSTPESTNEDKINIPSAEENFVSKKIAIYTAEQFANKYNGQINRLVKGKKISSAAEKKTVEHVLTLKDKKQKAALYLINYKDEGFVIVPADKRVPPILAHSKIKKMPINTDTAIPGGFAWWLGRTVAG
ncbi:MAG: Spi family protease inhibitor, partial [Balneolaceae bacterium]|nr:Spi family protease inhibitor [Balneolaceae bacterium]